MTKKNLPNLVIAGVNKAGTTSLFTYLKLHPEICASSVKETCYFLPVRYHGELSEPLDVYYQYFSHCSDSLYIMEATPGYFYGGRVIAQTIAKMLGDVRIIIVLREPVSRMFSFYRFQKSRLFIPQDMSFESYIKKCEEMPLSERRVQENNPFWGMEGGYYADYLPDWQEVFGSRLKVILFDDLVSDPKRCLKSIMDWLALDGSFYDDLELDVENRGVNFKNSRFQAFALKMNDTLEQFFRSFPAVKRLLRNIYYKFNSDAFTESLLPETRTYLKKTFLPYNQRLAKQLRDMGYVALPSWLKLDHPG